MHALSLSKSFISLLQIGLVLLHLGLVLLHVLALLVHLLLDLGQHTRDYLEVRQGHELKESYLTLGEVELIPITQVCNLQSQGLLLISLGEELAEQTLSPQLGNGEGSAGVADVSCMDQGSNEHELVLCVQFPVFRRLLAQALDLVLDLPMLGHVGTKDILENLFSAVVPVLHRQVLEYVAVVLLILDQEEE